MKINKEIGQLPLNLSIQKEYLENKFKDLGLLKESGYKSVLYFYSELYKEKERRKTFFTDKFEISDEYFGIVDKLN